MFSGVLSAKSATSAVQNLFFAREIQAANGAAGCHPRRIVKLAFGAYFRFKLRNRSVLPIRFPKSIDLRIVPTSSCAFFMSGGRGTETLPQLKRSGFAMLPLEGAHPEFARRSCFDARAG